MLYLFTLSVNVAEVSSFMLDFLMQQKEVNVMNVDKNNKSIRATGLQGHTHDSTVQSNRPETWIKVTTVAAVP